MKACEFDLMLESPLLVTGANGGDPNSEIGLPYVPGSVLRGALAWRYLAVNGKADDQFRRLFLRGAVRFLHAYPVASNGQRTLPAPLTWHKPKDATPATAVSDFARNGSPDDDQTWKSQGGQFCLLAMDGPAAAKVEFVNPPRQITVHTARANRQRPTAPGATVFRYEALAAGQTLRGVMLAEDSAALEKVLAMMPAAGGRLALGRSQNAGYGRVTVNYPGEPRFVNPAWQEYVPVGDSGGQLVVTLLSDAILTDPATGSPATNLDALVSTPAAHTYMRLCMTGGFNRTWNLPLPQTTAIAAGSVFVYTASAELAKRLTKLAESGIGQRVAEGYGRIAIDWHRVDSIARRKPDTHPQSRQSVPLTGASRTLAETMVKRLWQEATERQLTAFVSAYPLERNKLQNAQLSRLRVVARRDLEASNLAEMTKLKDFLDPKNLRRPAREQLRRAYINGKRLLDWLDMLACEPEKVWQEIDMHLLPTTAVGDVRAAPSRADAITAVVRLIDAVAQQAAKGAEGND